MVGQGEVLVQLDTRQEQAQLAAAEAQLELARLNDERMSGLVKEDAVSRAEFDAAAAAHTQARARVGEIRATIERKTIRAPFAGVLGIRQVNLGQYLTGGDPVVPLQALNPIHVNFGVPQQNAAQMRPGRQVRDHRRWRGRAGARGPRQRRRLGRRSRDAERPGAGDARESGRHSCGRACSCRSTSRSARAQSVVTLPASAISYAPYGDSVFVVADMKDPKGATYRGVRQQVVKLGGSRGDQVAVLSGIAPGDEVVTSGVFKLRNGVAVQVNNKVQPANSRAPKPEDS